MSLINDAVPGQPDLSDNLGAVHFAPESNLVWFAREGSVPQVWRVEAASLEVLVRPLPQSSDVRDFDSLGSGVIAGSDDGVFGSPDNLTFSAPDPDQEVFAVAQNADGGWAGDRALLEVDTGESFFPFADNDDNKIRALAGDGDRVWVGSDNQGIALFNGAIGEQVFTEAEGLPSNKVRGLAIDAAGDVWAATDRGVARFKSDRQKWIAMGAEAGLDPMLQNTVGIAVLEEGGQRHVVIGASGGIAILGP